jgi:hypothetical protein
MILVAQVLLTVQAWRKGWKGWALLPMGVALLLGLLLGSVTDDVERLVVPGLIGDLLSLAALIGLSVRGSQPAPAPTQQQVIAF